jgi:hypothetical protein
VGIAALSTGVVDSDSEVSDATPLPPIRLGIALRENRDQGSRPSVDVGARQPFDDRVAGVYRWNPEPLCDGIPHFPLQDLRDSLARVRKPDWDISVFANKTSAMEYSWEKTFDHLTATVTSEIYLRIAKALLAQLAYLTGPTGLVEFKASCLDPLLEDRSLISKIVNGQNAGTSQIVVHLTVLFRQWGLNPMVYGPTWNQEAIDIFNTAALRKGLRLLHLQFMEEHWTNIVESRDRGARPFFDPCMGVLPRNFNLAAILAGDRSSRSNAQSLTVDGARSSRPITNVSSIVDLSERPSIGGGPQPTPSASSATALSLHSGGIAYLTDKPDEIRQSDIFGPDKPLAESLEKIALFLSKKGALNKAGWQPFSPAWSLCPGSLGSFIFC